MSEEQAKSFRRRTVVGVELSDAPVDRHAEDGLDRRPCHGARRALAGAARRACASNLPKVPFRNCRPAPRSAPAPARPGHRRRRGRNPVPRTTGWRCSASTTSRRSRILQALQRLDRRFCSTDPKRLYGVPLVSVYDIKAGIKEMQRGHAWALKERCCGKCRTRACRSPRNITSRLGGRAEAGAPVVCHILTGHSYIKTGKKAA